MKSIKKIPVFVFLGLLNCLMLTAANAAPPNSEPCPAGTVPIQGHKCLLALTSDRTLSSTIVIGSRTMVDCQGHTLTPSVVGTLDDATTPANEFTPAQPDLAVFLNDTVDAKVQNCGIEGFDFGVYARNSDNNAIKQNTIKVRTQAIHFFNASNNKISDNEIEYSSERGRGIHLDYNSDYNVVEGNHVTSTGVAGNGLIAAEPGTWYRPLLVAQNAGSDIAIAVSGGPYFLLNLSVNGELFQVPFELDSIPDGNIFEDNETHHAAISSIVPPTRQFGFYVANGSRDTIVAHNQSTGGVNGFFLTGERAAEPYEIPGTCSISEDRCLPVPGFDCAAGAGTCEDHIQTTLDLRSRDTMVEENVLPGPYQAAAIQVQGTNLNATIRGNTITPTPESGNVIPVGIGLQGNGAIETARVERNRVSGATVALRLSVGGMPPAFFGAEVTLNDFTGNVTNVQSTGAPGIPYSLATELSVAGQGNYWGHSCAESNGFIEFGLPGADSSDADIIDSNAYGEAVALQDPLTATICPIP